jgi:DNA recombination-dependent growth factor C
MFRRSGSFACYFVEGSTPDPRSQEFLDALAEHRFRTIENAAAEQTSAGWVTSGDPSGGSFELEDDQDGAFWLRMRIDKKSAPTAWLKIHREAAEKSAGRKLSAKERKELKEDLLSKLMPRVLPTIRLVDALYVPKDGLILLFGTAKSVRESFLSLFYRTFSTSLTMADPYHLAMSLELEKNAAEALTRVAPVNWPGNTQDSPTLGDRPLPPLEAETADVGADNTEEMSA